MKKTGYKYIEKVGYFSHGPNLLGKHVDAIIIFSLDYPVLSRPATAEEIRRYCHKH